GEDPFAVGAALLSPALSALAVTTYLGAGLGATSLKLSARQVLALPGPACPLDEAIAALRAGDVVAAARAADVAYGVEDDAVWRWWCERAPDRKAESAARS